jgi:signal transduction histidine kinase
LDAIGQMTGGIAHDFNNLLTVIVGNLELLEMRSTDGRQLPLIRDALESAELGADLTSRLMIFARKCNLNPERADLRKFCSDTLGLLKRTIGATYHIRTDFADDLDAVMVDLVQLQSALMNLALNARDAMGSGGELMVSTQNVTIDDTYMAQETDIEPGDYVRLSVSDDGAGMNIEAQKRAFEPFLQPNLTVVARGLGWPWYMALCVNLAGTSRCTVNWVLEPVLASTSQPCRKVLCKVGLMLQMGVPQYYRKEMAKPS